VKIGTLGTTGALIYTTAQVYIGGAGVTSATGVSVPAMTSSSTPLFVPGGTHQVSFAIPSGPDVTPDLYAIAASTTATVSFFTAG
jgi:hypothetical protein